MWKNKNVWILLSGEFIAGVGLWTGIIGNLEFMQEHVPSDFFKALILFIGLLAGVMVGPLAGRVIDSNKKKTVLIFSGLVRIFSVCFMFMALYFESIIFMILFMITIQLSAAFYFPALQSLIPMIVREKDLLQMNGLHMNIATIARILGTAIAGAMLVVMSLYSLYIASIVAYTMLFISTLLLDVDESQMINDNSEKTRKQSGSFKEVLPVLKGLPIAMMVLILTIIPMLFIGGFNLMVINISELQSDSTIKGLLYTTEGICFMLGAFLVKRISEGKNQLNLMFIFTFGIAISLLLLFFADIKAMSLLAFGLFGLSVGCFFPIASTIFQTRIPKEFHGRFFSFRNMLDRVLFQVVLLGTGLILDTIGLKMMGLIFGTISLTVIFYFGTKQIKSPIQISEEASKQTM
ncbi:MFS transporter [Bacillus timonensis]|nr:MFS transporter [Bacillus timonensis]